MASGSEEYHLAAAGRDVGAIDSCDGRNCGLASDARGTDRMLELNARDFLRSVLGIIMEDVCVACCKGLNEIFLVMNDRLQKNAGSE